MKRHVLRRQPPEIRLLDRLSKVPLSPEERALDRSRLDELVTEARRICKEIGEDYALHRRTLPRSSRGTASSGATRSTSRR